MVRKSKQFFSYLWTHKRISIPLVVILLGIIFIFRPKPAPPIATQSITLGDITQSLSVSGSVLAKTTSTLSFPIGGTISWVGVKAGDTVTQGQTIAVLDQRTVLKNLQNALTNYNLQRDTFDQAVANNNGISNPANALNDNMKRVLQDNQYNLDLAVNSVELQDLARQQAILSSPIAGIVTRADATTPGVTATPTMLFTVVDPNSVVFSMDVDEADIGKVVLGQKAQISLDAYPDETLTLPINFIDFVSHTTVNGGNAFPVQVPLNNNSSYRYRVGMNGNATIIIAEKKRVLTVPLSSVTDTNAVYVKQGSKFVEKHVTLGIQSDTDAQVLSGLHVGDVVALDPTQVVKTK